MNFMDAIGAVNTVMANWDTIATGVLAIIGGFSILAKLTPTPKDDKIVAKIVKVLDFLAMNKQRTVPANNDSP